MKINSKICGIIAIILMASGGLLCLYTIPIDKMEPGVKMKLDASGAGRAHEVGYGFRDYLRPIGIGLLIAGSPFLLIASIKDHFKDKKLRNAIKRIANKENPADQAPPDQQI